MADIVQLEEKGNLLYPKTHTSAIDNFDEAVVKKTGDENISGVKNFKDGIQQNGKALLTETELSALWTGGWVMNTTQTVTPKKKLTECRTGWILRWQRILGGEVKFQDYNYTYVPKQHTIDAAGMGVSCMIDSGAGDAKSVKYIYVRDENIKGHGNNSTNPSGSFVLTAVFEF